jgi:membrane-associated phospholipid phosphatase
MRISVKRNVFSHRSNKKKRLFAKPTFYYIFAIILFICAIIVHPWDIQYKEYITTHRFLDIAPLSYLLGLVRVFGNGGITAILALLFAAYGYKKLAYRIAVSLIVMGIIVNVLKPIVGRERPNERNNHSFPSGDTATAAAFFPPMAAESNFFIPGTIILTPAVGFLRTYDNWHWLSDVVTGMGVGFLAVGFALYFCEKKNRFYKLICYWLKPRHYAIISLIVLLACFIPELISGGGKYMIFTSFFGPALYVWLIALYIPILFKERSEKNKPIFKPVGRLKQYYNQDINNTLHPKAQNIASSLAVILALILIIPPWIFNSVKYLVYPASGIGIGIIALIIAVYRIKQSNNYKRIKPTLISGTIVLVIFALLTLLPALLRG